MRRRITRGEYKDKITLACELIVRNMPSFLQGWILFQDFCILRSASWWSGASVEDARNVEGDEASESRVADSAKAEEPHGSVRRTELRTSEEKGGPGSERPLP